MQGITPEANCTPQSTNGNSIFLKKFSRSHVLGEKTESFSSSFKKISFESFHSDLQREGSIQKNISKRMNRVQREVGGGIGMGNTCNSMADSCQCMTKPTAML